MYDSSSPRITFFDRATVLYLAIPNLIYLVGWLKPIYGIPAAIVTFAILVSLLGKSGPARYGVSKGCWMLAAVIAGVWIYFSGIGHMTHATHDWHYRDAVLADMTNKPWPVTYAANAAGQERLLRAPIGYYMLAAVAGKVGGNTVALAALVVWSWLGIVLVFGLMLQGVRDLRVAVLRVLVFLFFSGADYAGYKFIHGSVNNVSLEWWAEYFQYSANTTALFWVPNHAISAWIATAWLVGSLRECLNVKVAALILCFTPLFSPFSAAGLLPLFGVAMLTGGKADRESWGVRLRGLIDLRLVVLAFVFAVCVFGYLTLATEKIERRWSFDGINPYGYTFRLILFIVLEFLALNLLLIRRYRDDALLWVVLAVLLVLPFPRVGPGSDLTMRASLPALAYLAIRLGKWFSEIAARKRSVSSTDPDAIIAKGRCSRWMEWSAIILFALGCAVPILEIRRAITTPAWPYDPKKSIVDVEDDAPQYMCPRETTWSQWFLPDVPRAKE